MARCKKPSTSDSKAKAMAETPSSAKSYTTNTHLNEIRNEYGIPPEISLRVPREDERVDTVCSGEFSLYMEYLKVGLRLPLGEYEKDVLRAYKVPPSQLSPNAWRSIIGFKLLAQSLGLTPTAALFSNLFRIIGSSSGFWFYFSPRPKRKVLSSGPSSIHNWKRFFFFVEMSPDDDGRLQNDWRSDSKMSSNPDKMMSLSVEERHSLKDIIVQRGKDGLFHVENALDERPYLSGGGYSISSDHSSSSGKPMEEEDMDVDEIVCLVSKLNAPRPKRQKKVAGQKEKEKIAIKMEKVSVPDPGKTVYVSPPRPEGEGATTEKPRDLYLEAAGKLHEEGSSGDSAGKAGILDPVMALERLLSKLPRDVAAIRSLQPSRGQLIADITRSLYMGQLYTEELTRISKEEEVGALDTLAENEDLKLKIKEANAEAQRAKDSFQNLSSKLDASRDGVTVLKAALAQAEKRADDAENKAKVATEALKVHTQELPRKLEGAIKAHLESDEYKKTWKREGSLRYAKAVWDATMVLSFLYPGLDLAPLKKLPNLEKAKAARPQIAIRPGTEIYSAEYDFDPEDEEQDEVDAHT